MFILLPVSLLASCKAPFRRATSHPASSAPVRCVRVDPNRSIEDTVQLRTEDFEALEERIRALKYKMKNYDLSEEERSEVAHDLHKAEKALEGGRAICAGTHALTDFNAWLAEAPAGVFPSPVFLQGDPVVPFWWAKGQTVTNIEAQLLAKFLQDASVSNRSMMIMALSRFATSDVALVTLFTNGLMDTECNRPNAFYLKEYAVNAVKKLGPDKVLPLVEGQLAVVTNEPARFVICDLLRWASCSPTNRVWQALLGDPSENVRRRADANIKALVSPTGKPQGVADQ